ncbi:MAG: RNA polymerase III subunit C82 [Lichina confinis]|nr:MAG: RNA polymerase III subunit C82 [Lichina confinis]
MRFGQTSGELVSNLLLQGHTRIGDLVEAYTDTLVAGRPQKKDGNDKTDETAVTGTDATDLCSAGYSSEQPASKQASLTQLRDILERFDEHQFIYTVLQHQFYPHSDIVNELSRHLRKRGFQEGIKGSARSLEFGGHLRRLLSRLRDDDDHAGSVPGQTRTLKRILDETGSGPQAKRAKIVITDDGPLSETSHRWPDGTHIQDGDRKIRINIEKYLVFSRNQRLAEDAALKFGTTTALVYAGLLTRLSDSIPRCVDELAEDDDADSVEEGPSITVEDFAPLIRSDIDLVSAFGTTSRTNLAKMTQSQRVNGTGRRKGTDLGSPDVKREAKGSKGIAKDKERNDRLTNGEKSDVEEGNADEGFWEQAYHDMGEGFWAEVFRNADRDSSTQVSSHHIRHIEQHLQLLAQPPRSYVRRIDRNNRVEWMVDFPELVSQIRQSELQSIVSDRFGAVALRLVRILQEKGRLDEKQIANAALIRQKDIRATLTAMHEAGFLELQEVPRDHSYHASRTVFLWFFDPARCGRSVLEGAYKSMARFLQRLAAERKKRRSVLDKSQRTDVVGNEEKYLSPREREVLRDWKVKEEKLLGQIMRLDRMVELFRDF